MIEIFKGFKLVVYFIKKVRNIMYSFGEYCAILTFNLYMKKSKIKRDSKS